MPQQEGILDLMLDFFIRNQSYIFAMPFFLIAIYYSYQLFKLWRQK